MNDCIFCKIAKGEISTKFVYEDSDVVVFPDIRPFKPVHLLIVPKKHIPDFLEVQNASLFEKLCSIAQKMVKKEHLNGKGYRLSINGGGAQIINHLHIHLMGPMGLMVKD